MDAWTEKRKVKTLAGYDIREVKIRASGRWADILNKVAGIPDDFLSGQEMECPKCGGTKRWRFTDFKGDGGAICNQCGKFGDGFAVVMHFTGCDFSTAKEKVAQHLGLTPTRNGKPKQSKRDPDQHLEFLDWNDMLAGYFCAKKQPITLDAIKAAGGRLAKYRGRHNVIAIPAYGPVGSIVAWTLYEVFGGKLPVFHGKGKPIEQVKVKTTGGSEAGLMGNTTGAVVWKTEGPTDMLALLSLGLPEGHSACCNVFGAGENPTSWMLDRFKDLRVFVIHDCDIPGQQGATEVNQGGRTRPGWAPMIAQSAAECRNVVLPYEITGNRGKDLRDWINEQLETGLPRAKVYQKLVELAESSEAIAAAKPEEGSQAIEDDDDPHRLARINLANYQSRYGGTLKFWRDQFWRWKDGRYTRMGNRELEAKLTASIKEEFDRSYREAVERGEDIKAARKVTQSCVKNTLGALKSLTILPASIEMPCWLDENRSRPHYLALKNGILDLDAVFDGKDAEKCMLPLSPKWFSAFALDYEFDPEATCPLWLEYMDVVMEGDEERIAVMQEWMGYCLTPNNDLQRFICLEGEGGNGKTVFFAGVEAVIGEGNVSNVSLEEFGGRFDLASTLGKAVNIAADVGELDKVAEGKLKSFTGGDAMHFDRKGVDPISARPTAKLMCAWNNRPHLRDRSSGLWRRMILVPFDRQIKASERVRGMDRPSWWAGNGQVPGMLNWALVGLHRLLEQGDFTRSKRCDEAFAEYRLESNPAAEFLSEYLEVAEDKYKQDPDDYVLSARLYELYRFWCGKLGFYPLASRTFFKELNRLYSNAERYRLSFEGRPWAYRGIQYTVEEIMGEPVKKKEW